MKKQRTDINSKYFKLKQFEFNKREAKEAIKDLERFLRLFKQPFEKENEKTKPKGTYWKLTPKYKKEAEKIWLKTYYAFKKREIRFDEQDKKEKEKEKKINSKDIEGACAMCSKQPVKWGIKVNDFVNEKYPEIDLRYLYCCSDMCTQCACALISMGGVEFKERK